MIVEFLSEVGVGDDAKVESPAANCLFEIDESVQLLDENDKGFISCQGFIYGQASKT